MKTKTLTLHILDERMAVCRFDASDPVPDGIDQSHFYSITRTEQELTIVCPETLVARGTTSETGWRCFKVQGPLDFSETGIIASLSRPLAEKGVAVFVLSTFDTDYFMVKEKNLAAAVDVLTASGHRVKKSG